MYILGDVYSQEFLKKATNIGSPTNNDDSTVHSKICGVLLSS